MYTLAAQTLGDYLAALGLLRALQGLDAGAKLAWTGRGPVVMTRWPSVTDYMLGRWAPTPVVSPWNGGSGFWGRDRQAARQWIETSREDRLADYREAFASAAACVAAVGARPTGDAKLALIGAVRDALPDAARPWHDAVIRHLPDGGVEYAPIAGTGGNVGRAELSRLTHEHLHRCLTHSASRSWLTGWLEQTPVRGVAVTGAHLWPGAASIVPWAWLMAIEGLCAIGEATGLPMRVHANPAVRASPWTCSGMADHSSTEAEVADGRGELWLPLWEHPLSYPEVCELLRTPAPQLAGRTATTALDWMRAPAARAEIVGYARFALLRRHGQQHVALRRGVVRAQ